MESQSTYELVRTWASAGGLVFMVVLFASIVAYALWPKNKKQFDRLAQLPLQDDDKPADSKKAENGDTDSTETGR